MWNNSAPLNSSGAERSPPLQTGGNRPEGSEAIVGQTAYGSGFRLSSQGSVIILHSVRVCAVTAMVTAVERRALFCEPC